MQSRAVTAQQLLENPVLHEAVAAEEVRILTQMRQCSLADRETHTRLVMALQMSTAVSRNLWVMIQDGKEAAESIRLRGSRID